MPNKAYVDILDFKGTNKYLSIGTCESLSTNCFTSFAVVKANAMNDSATGYILASFDSAVRWGCGERSGNNMWFTLSRGTVLKIPNLTGINQDQWHILSMSWNGNTGEVHSRSLSQNDILKTNRSTGAFNISRTHVRTRIGCNADNSPNYFFNGHIAEILIYSSALTISELEIVENYLKNKYFHYFNRGLTLLVN